MEFLLYDNNYASNDLNGYVDLIILKKYVKLEEIEKTIQEIKDNDYEENGFYTYTNYRIYETLNKKYGITKIINLSSLNRIEY